jgi:hypothetical protein
MLYTKIASYSYEPVNSRNIVQHIDLLRVGNSRYQFSTNADASMQRKAVQALSKQTEFLCVNGEAPFRERPIDSATIENAWANNERQFDQKFDSTVSKESGKTTSSPRLSQSALAPDLYEFAPKIVVVGVGGAGSNAINNMIAKGLQGMTTNR